LSLRRRRIPLLPLSILVFSITVNAQNWPSFRGPNASGVADGTKPPTTWDVDKTQNVLWKTGTPGLSHASPVLWGNQIFVITAVSSDSKTTFAAKDRGLDLAIDNAKQTEMIFTFDKRNGRVLWSNTAYGLCPAVVVNRKKRALCPRFGLCPHFQRPEAEPGAQPIIPEIADGAAQPRLTSGGRAEVGRSN